MTASTQPLPNTLKVQAAVQLASAEHPAARFYLRELARSFHEIQESLDPDAGPIVRISRWWDEDPDDGGRLNVTFGEVEEITQAAPDPQEAQDDLDRLGYHDMSDSSQPMAELYVNLRFLAFCPPGGCRSCTASSCAPYRQPLG